MATYKVLQDIEAEDKLVGPLTLRQFIYAGIAAVCGYLIFLLFSKGAGVVAVIFFPPMVICGFFAYPWTKDQPTEVWALARIRFLVKPRKRIWNQSGVKELVTITVPKKIERNYTNGLSETEVRSRLSALATTIDSRGWAIKNVNVNLYSQPALVMAEPNSDRLMGASSLPQEVPIIDILASDDILDTANNARAAQVENKLEEADKARRERVMSQLQAPVPAPAPMAPPPAPAQPAGNNYWFLNQPNNAATTVPQDVVTFNTQVITPGVVPVAAPVIGGGTPASDEASLIKELDAKRQAEAQANSYAHLHTLQPISAQQAAHDASARARSEAMAREQARMKAGQAAVPPVPKPAILDSDLVNKDDWSVANIAREAKKRHEASGDEVVISLH